jgi:hypothetical protein
MHKGLLKGETEMDVLHIPAVALFATMIAAFGGVMLFATISDVIKN